MIEKLSVKKGLVLMLALFTAITAIYNSAEAKPVRKLRTDANQEQFASKGDELTTKAQAFNSNAQSFKVMIQKLDNAKSQGTNYKEQLDQQLNDINAAIDSMIKSTADMQQIAKKMAMDEQNQEKKNFYNREIIPNLQNLNRQSLRIQDSLKRSRGDMKPIIMQADRIEQVSKQVVDRMKNNAR